MKIKSHTGDMVEARVDDVVNVVGIGKQTISHFVDGLIRLDRKFADYHPVCCTLVHRPFQVGDETEFLSTFPNNWVENGKIETQLHADRCNASLRVRHSNPALRDAPEYKP